MSDDSTPSSTVRNDSCQSPLVSILMPVYNSEVYLAEAIASMLGQTYSHFEFLIIDDGSTDHSWEIVQRYAAQDSRIKAIRRENRGLPRTLNEMIKLASGDLLARMDADDVSLPDRFALQVEFMRQHPQVVCLGGAYDRIDEKGRFLDHYNPPESNAELQQYLLRGMTLILHPSAMLRRSAVDQVGGYDERMVGSSDLDLWLRLGEVGEVANIPETLVKYRLHPGSITYKRQQRQTQDALGACQRAWQRRGVEGEFAGGSVDYMKQHQYLLRWGWQGFNQGQRQMAIDYGLRAVANDPLNLEGWRLLVCALVKPLPKSEAV